MEKRAREFLDLTSRYYEKNKVKWENLIKGIGLKFSEDVYNDTIISVYERISNGEDLDNTPDDEIIAYWYRSFVNNLKKNKNSKIDEADVIELLKNEEYVVDSSNLYYATIRLIFNKVKEEYDPQSYHIFRMYYMDVDMTFEELSSIVGFDVKPRISRIRRWLTDVVQQNYC